MKSLRKSLDILEYIMAQNGRPVTPSELSQYCKINITSCVRMVKTLTDRAYLAQVSRRSGYVGGPALVAERGKHGVYYDLQKAAIPAIDALSRRMNCMVNLSIVHNDLRYLLYTCGENPSVHGSPVLSKPWDFAGSATERLLLSALPEKDRKRIFAKIGIPLPFADYQELTSALEQYRKDGCVAFQNEALGLWIIGGLIEATGYPPAAIAFGVTSQEQVKNALKQALECTAQIKSRLIHPPQPLF